MDGNTNHWKLGLFVVIGAALAVGTAFWLGAATLKEQRPLRIVTYFNESVQGLSEGAAVRFRGVKIGEVQSIRVANDMVRLEVLCKVQDGALGRLRPPGPEDALPRVVDDLTTQLVSSSLTGQKYVDVDVADPALGPARIPEGVIPPTEAEIFIASRTSTLKSVEEALKGALAFFESVGPDVGTTVSSVASVLTDIRDASLPAEVRRTLANADGALGLFHQRVADVDTARLSTSASKLLEDTTAAVNSLQFVLASLAQEDAPESALSKELTTFLHVTSTELTTFLRATSRDLADARLPQTAESVRIGAERVSVAADAVANASDRVAQLTDGLDETLTSLRETIDALRSLIVVLEHDPSSILRGRTYGAPPPPAGGGP